MSRSYIPNPMMKKVYLVEIINTRIFDYDMSKFVAKQIIIGEENLKVILEIFPMSKYIELN